MKIYTILRTRNESKNIERFIHCYINAGVDKILIADGGSEDDTVSIAEHFYKVEVRNFTERVQGKNGLWRNGEGKHWNFLIDWAKEDGADWIVHADADCVPNKILQISLRSELECAEQKWQKNVVLAYQMFIYGQDQYFPNLSNPGPGLYAWHRDADVRFSEADPWNVDLENYDVVRHGTYDIALPATRLHYFCPDPETTMAKHIFYRDSGQQPGHVLPTESCGALEPLKDWMRWK